VVSEALVRLFTTEKCQIWVLFIYLYKIIVEILYLSLAINFLVVMVDYKTNLNDTLQDQKDRKINSKVKTFYIFSTRVKLRL